MLFEFLLIPHPSSKGKVQASKDTYGMMAKNKAGLHMVRMGACCETKRSCCNSITSEHIVHAMYLG